MYTWPYKRRDVRDMYMYKNLIDKNVNFFKLVLNLQKVIGNLPTQKYLNITFCMFWYCNIKNQNNCYSSEYELLVGKTYDECYTPTVQTVLLDKVQHPEKFHQS